VLHQSGDAGNRGGEDQAFARRRLHQDDRHALAAAGKHHEVGAAIVVIQLMSGHMPQEDHVFFKFQFTDELLKPDTLGPVARDQA
jgi:hypothetical protein